MKDIRLTLCMIVKDEAHCLLECLESVHELVDEVVLVDTGSSDGTPNIARTAGARVFYFDWNDNFSAARNESLKYAAGKWILVLDADELIDPKDHSRIRELLKAEDADAYRLEQRTYQQQSTLAEWTALKEDTPLSRGCSGFIPSPLVRLFRNLQSVRFRGRVHEIVEHDLIAQCRPIVDTDIPIHHYGKIISDDKICRKQRLYRRIGEKILKENSTDCRTLSDLGVQYLELNQNREAVQALQAAYEINPKDSRIAFNLAVGLARLGQVEPAAEIYQSVIDLDPTHVGAYNNLAQILQNQNARHAEVETLFKAALKHNPDHHVLYYNYGLFLEKKGLYDRANRQYQNALKVDPGFKPAFQKLKTLQEKPSTPVYTSPIPHGYEPNVGNGSENTTTLLQERSHQMTWGPIEQEVKQGEALFQNDEIEEALALFDSILKKSPGHVPALNNKGVALNRLGKHQDAEETFWKVLAIDENNADAVYNLVLNYVQGEQLNRVDQILKDYGHTLSESDIQGITGAIEEIFQKANLPPPPDQHQNRPSPIKEEKEMEWCATKLNLNLDILAPKDTSLKDKYAIGTRLLLLMKTNLIRSADAKYHKFLGAYKNVEAHTLLDFDRAFILYQTALSTSHLNGCSAECGVFRGGSSALIADIEPTRKHYALDTYEGFPDMFTDVDLHESGNFSDVSYEDIQALFSSHSNIVILKGRFDESFHMIRNEVFSFIHIDSDLYASTLECIEFFYPRMLPGGIILFDDYLIPDTPGVKKAVDEFFREKREHPVILPTFQAMVIKSI